MAEDARQLSGRRPATGRHALRLVLGCLAMFGFGYALVPLYGLICDITGLNGQSSSLRESAAALPDAVDTGRTVRIEFVTTVHGGQPWEFEPEQPYIEVHPGQPYRVSFHARNPHPAEATARATPSVAPGRGARHLRKTECFCFTEQHFGPGEAREMPVVFFVDPELPADIDTLTLSYTLFEIGGEPQLAGRR